MIRLEGTSGSAVAAAIAAERRRQGSTPGGMVLTLLILCDEEHASDATTAAVQAARQHPMRILTLIRRPGGPLARLDAEISVGAESGPGEVVELRLRGDLAEHANSVAIPLLLPDTPVVAFWPGVCPDIPEADPIGRHAQRRITDAAGCPNPLVALQERVLGYRSGDTDLAWGRLTPWRSVLASAMDQAHPPILSAIVEAEVGNASAVLMRQWLADCLAVPVDLRDVDGSGVMRVALETAQGDISVVRSDPGSAILSRPGVPDAAVALVRRDFAALLSEELRRLDPDEVYGRTLRNLGRA